MRVYEQTVLDAPFLDDPLIPACTRIDIQKMADAHREKETIEQPDETPYAKQSLRVSRPALIMRDCAGLRC